MVYKLHVVLGNIVLLSIFSLPASQPPTHTKLYTYLPNTIVELLRSCFPVLKETQL
jgi:hypothetical protein